MSHSQTKFRCACVRRNSIRQRENQALTGAIPYCGEYPGPRFEDNIRSANQMDGISKAGEIRWLPVKL